MKNNEDGFYAVIVSFAVLVIVIAGFCLAVLLDRIDKLTVGYSKLQEQLEIVITETDDIRDMYMEYLREQR